MAVTSTARACDTVIFGAKGDLARRKLLPSLYQLESRTHPRIRGSSASAARSGIKAYTEVVKEALGTFMKEKLDDELWATLSAHGLLQSGRQRQQELYQTG